MMTVQDCFPGVSGRNLEKNCIFGSPFTSSDKKQMTEEQSFLLWYIPFPGQIGDSRNEVLRLDRF